MPRKAILLSLVFLFAFLGFAKRPGASPVVVVETPPLIQSDGTYRTVLSAWNDEALGSTSGVFESYLPNQFASGVLFGALDSFGKPQSLDFPADQSVSLVVDVPTSGLYELSIEYYSLSENQIDFEICVSINGELPYQEACQIALPKWWRFAAEGFPTDRYGNDFYQVQEQIFEWRKVAFFDPMGLYSEPLRFALNAGENTIQITNQKGAFRIAAFDVRGVDSRTSYATYASGATLHASPVTILLEAETPDAKNAPTIQPGVSRDALVTPFAVDALRLNTLAAGSWQTIRQRIGYEVEVDVSGWYQLSFKVLQNGKTNGVVYRSLFINGTIPFAQAERLAIEYDTKWQWFTPSDSSGNAYLYFLTAGSNTIDLAVQLDPYREAYHAVSDVLAYVNATALEIRRLTGNQLDEDRDWDILDYMPTLQTDLYAMANRLEAVVTQIAAMSQTTKPSETESSLQNSVRNLRFLAKDPNEVPKHITLLTTSSSSIAQTLGGVITDLLTSPLTMDQFAVHSGTVLPKANASFFGRFWLQTKRFFRSFFDTRYRYVASEDELDVWVNRPKQYVDLIQKLADERFTSATGIEVRISVLADEGKLILANSASRNPDVALGISAWMPYDLGIRGALADLSDHAADPEFAETLQLYPEQALIPMIYDKGIYGLPDTENFYVLFFRTDILNALNLAIPDTWEDVVKLMPTLRRYGMNFYLPLSSASSLKAFDSTLPFLFQYGSPVYASDAFSADLNNEASINALKMMTELYTIYSLETTVSNFYNDFRLARSPIGVGDFGMYIRLLNAAPDIQGLWGIAPMPGVEQDGEVVRYAPGAQTANVIFEKNDKKAESWAFLKWWSSTETQVDFQNYLLSTLGREYLWNSANRAAFEASGYEEADMEVILEQWDWLKELPKVPGSYQVELEISNVWNSVVLERANLRVRLNDALITADREIRKKMAEFGYMDKSGAILKDYVIADLALIRSWTGGDDHE
jgi:ABC-type glycerol-3-phosphate transport system substrate-binding protein